MMCIKEKWEFNTAISKQLEAHLRDRDSIHDAHLFVSYVSDGKGGALTSQLSGARDAVTQMLLQAFNGDDSAMHPPHDFQAALFTAVANMIAEFPDGRELAFRLGTWVEKKFGNINCTC